VAGASRKHRQVQGGLGIAAALVRHCVEIFCPASNQASDLGDFEAASF